MRRAGCRRSIRARLRAYHGRIKLVPFGFSQPPQRSISWPSRCTAGLCRFACNCSPVSEKGRGPRDDPEWDTAVVLNLRFYPDMFPLERQVRQVCNHALGAARVAGVGLPSLPDQDNSFAEIQSRIDKVIDCLKGLRPDQIDGKDDAKVTVTIGGQPQELSGQNYLYHFAILQVQFHATTAYDILRSTGVNIGKRDYLGPRPT